MALVGPEKIAQALNLTVSRVHQLVKEGMPKEGRGSFDPILCLMFYIRYLQKVLAMRSAPELDGGYIGERVARVRLLRAHADLREMELAKERSQLVAIQDVEQAMTDLIRTTTARIMAVAPQLAPELLGLTSRVMAHAIIEKRIKEALLDLSKHKLRTHAPANSSGREAP